MRDIPAPNTDAHAVSLSRVTNRLKVTQKVRRRAGLGGANEYGGPFATVRRKNHSWRDGCLYPPTSHLIARGGERDDHKEHHA